MFLKAGMSQSSLTCKSGNGVEKVQIKHLKGLGFGLGFLLGFLCDLGQF